MADDIGVGLRTLQRAVARLSGPELGCLEVVKQGPHNALYIIKRQLQNGGAFGGTFGGTRQRDLFTEIKPEKESRKQQRPAKEASNSKRKPGAPTNAADDLRYRQEFTEAVRGFAPFDRWDERGQVTIVAAARASGLGVGQAARVFADLVSQDRFQRHKLAYFIGAFRDELSKCHRQVETESERNVSPSITDLYQDPELERLREKFPDLYAEVFGVVAPTMSEPGRVSQRSLDESAPCEQKENRNASEVRDGARVDMGINHDRGVLPGMGSERIRPLSERGRDIDRTALLGVADREISAVVPTADRISLQERADDLRDGLAVLVSPVSRMDSGSAVLDMQPVVLGRLADARLAGVDEGILHQGVLRRSGGLVVPSANAPTSEAAEASRGAPKKKPNGLQKLGWVIPHELRERCRGA